MEYRIAIARHTKCEKGERYWATNQPSGEEKHERKQNKTADEVK